MEFEESFKVGDKHSAKHLGSGDVSVLSTPSMILFMEEACRVFADDNLGKDQTTVGIHVDIYHVRACPVGSEIRVRAKVLRVDRKRIVFWVEAWRGDELIGYGLHERYVINKEAFLNKVRVAKNDL